ncbi:MAG: glycosyltransferase [Desulfomonilaceae bacterium]
MENCPPKLLIVTPEFPPEQWGGLAQTVFKVAVHSLNMGFETHVVRLTVKPNKIVLLDENVKINVFKGIKIFDIIVGKEKYNGTRQDIWDCPHNLSLQMMFQSLEFLEKKEKYDIYQSFFLYPIGYVTGLLAAKWHKPMISCVVGNDVNKYFFSPEKVAVCKSALENSDFVVGLSQDLIELANALSPIRGKSCLIYNSVEVPVQSWAQRSEPTDNVKIGCAGIFKYAKGLPYLLKALAILSKSWNVNLELRGLLRDSEIEAFNEILARTKTINRVTLLEPVLHESIFQWLRTLDLFVLPSVTEGCPNILMEALAVGVPTVTTDVGAVSDLIEDGVSGLLVPPGNSTALAEAIERLLKNSNLAHSLSGSARERMRGFSAQKEQDDWEEVYRRFVDIKVSQATSI